MNFRINRWLFASAFALGLALVSLTNIPVNSQGRAVIKIDGSSTVYPITEAVAEEFQNKKRGSVQVTVGISGTGGGFKKFCSDNNAVKTDISNASRPIKDKEKEMCKAAGVKYLEIPVAYDAITVVVKKDNPLTNITTAELKKMWEPAATKKIMKWNQVNSSWPDAPLKLYGPGADSGTFDYFTEEIMGKSGESRTDYTPSEDDNVLVQGVGNDNKALAYFGFTYYEENENKLKALKIDGVAPSSKTVSDGTYKPLGRPIFIYVNLEAAKSKPAVKEFVQYYLDNAPKLVKEVRSIPRTDYQAHKQKFTQAIR
ncbi:PstS family phosphate ABC transporter substrate-binding protein [Crocosphaera sp. XPORK-15E]|uniref:PstS family phosphate ABC transporter substrate-binding protein n=1 Tax=Crocosphaera sp. XPORK-15E TaxID=3110247 RepID=UPI002B213D63|nr:PstS family phosphate ABC transporter substrate-binding protein [Crocosphaera sp. XPORK-15E]MEA5532476.1 PstS family phosphate ABC transporter substrate-binding protein [Crocosphaera sp. XPORK-15E]